MRVVKSYLIFPVAALLLSGLFAVGMELESPFAVLAFLLLAAAVAALANAYLGKRLRRAAWPKPASVMVVGSLAVAIFALPLMQSGDPYSIYSESRALVLSAMLLPFVLTLGLTGIVDLGMGAFIGVGAYASTRLTLGCGLPVLLGPLLGGAISGLLAVVLGPLLLRTRGHYFSLATLAFGLVAYNLFVRAAYVTGGVDGIRNIPGVGLSLVGDSRPNTVSYYWVAIWVLFMLVFCLRFGGGQFGRCLRSLKDEEEAATGCGVDPVQYRQYVYAAAAAIAGVAGALHAQTVHYIAPGDFDLQFGIYLLALAVLGGSGNPAGCIASAFAMTFLEEKLRAFGDYRMLSVAVAILWIMLSRVKGAQRRALAVDGA
jgi:branched-chain amino acid transport system permease protein